MQCDLAVCVLPGADSDPPFSRLINSYWADEVGMRFQRVIKLRLKAGEAGYAPVEYDQRGLAISPGQVAQKLVNRLNELLLASPHFALPDKCGPVIELDPDVCLACTPKSFSRRVALIVAVEMSKDDVAQLFLVMFRKSTRSGLE